MHENREISCASWSTDQDRSAKAINRAADANVQEKSDCAVILVSQPNNERQLSPEAGEGRAQTQENIVQSHMRPTQSGKRMSQGLRGVRQASRERKQERFTALLHHLSVRLLRDSFYALKRQASPGVDGVTWQEYETGLEDRLVDLRSRVHRGAYQARPSRRVYIPKADGRQRPLGIAPLEDKIVQQAVMTILNQIYEVDFKGFSYGFRPGRGPHQALDALTVNAQLYDTTLSKAWYAGIPAATLRSLNDKLLESERRLTTEEGLLRRPWYKHMIYAPGVYSGYDSKTIPGVREAIEQKRWDEANAEIMRVAKVLDAESALIKSAAADLEQSPSR